MSDASETSHPIGKRVTIQAAKGRMETFYSGHTLATYRIDLILPEKHASVLVFVDGERVTRLTEQVQEIDVEGRKIQVQNQIDPTIKVEFTRLA